jgi:hypothetical protein
MAARSRASNTVSRKAKTIKINFADLEGVQVILPPNYKGLPGNLTMVFDQGRPRIGFTKPGMIFDYQLDEVKRLGQIPMICNAISPEGGMKQAASLVASLVPGADPKLVPEIGGTLVQVQKFLKNIDQLKKVVEERPATGLLHEESKAVLLRIIPILRGFIKQTVDDAKNRKKFSDLLEEGNFPKDVANRLIGGSINFMQNDLIRAFYPSDPSKHLNLSIKELMNGAHELFKEVLSKPAKMAISHFLSLKMRKYLDSFNPDNKPFEYRVQMPCPLPLKDLFRSRNRRYLGPIGNEAYRILWNHNCVFTYPQWINTGGLGYMPKDLAIDLLEIKTEAIPTDIKGWEDMIPEGVTPHIAFFEDAKKVKRIFDSFDLGSWNNPESKVEEYKSTNYSAKSVEHYEIKIDEAKVIKIEPRIPNVQVGVYPLTDHSKQLVTSTNKIKPQMARVLKNYLTNFPKDLQNYAVNVITARLQSGIEEEPDPIFGSDEPQETEEKGEF